MAAGGGFISSADQEQYSGGLTCYVLMTCIIAAFGGLLFGYDIGISGGVTSMPPFLKKFFPSVYQKLEGRLSTNQYCTFDSQLLTLFTSSLFIAALFASFIASFATKKYGRKFSIFWGGLIFLVGATLNSLAQNIYMLIVGRILLGLGVGFTTQSIPLFLSEMAPCQYRGCLNIGFQLMITIGILSANVINYGANKISGGWGWRLSLGLAGVPAFSIMVGSCFLPDTPNSLVERGKLDKGKEVLQRIRGTDDIHKEFNDLLDASTTSKAMQSQYSWKTIFERKYRPQLMMSLLLPLFGQLTGINVIMFYAPVLFKTIGFNNNASLMAAVVTGGVNVLATFIAIFSADKFGRKFLYMSGGMVMFVCQIVFGSLLWYKLGVTGVSDISGAYSYLLVALICIYVSGFAWSWGALGCLVPSEIFPLEIRSIGQSINVAVSMLITFIIGQFFLSMLCILKFGLFYLFGICVSIMTLFIILFLPETKDIPIELTSKLWKKHWFWKRYVNDGNRSRSVEML